MSRFSRRCPGLWRRSQVQERPAFEELLARHLDMLYRVALRCKGGQRQGAEDLLQEAVLRAWRGYGALRDVSAAKTWLVRTLVRTHQNQARAAGRGEAVALADLDEAALERALADWRPGPEGLAARAETGERLAEALEALPPSWALIVQLVDIEGLRLREAAQALNLAPGTVASRRFRALMRLRSLLVDYQDVDHG